MIPCLASVMLFSRMQLSYEGLGQMWIAQLALAVKRFPMMLLFEERASLILFPLFTISLLRSVQFEDASTLTPAQKFLICRFLMVTFVLPTMYVPFVMPMSPVP